MTPLRWDMDQAGNWLAYSGEIMVGMVIHRFDGRIVWDATNAVHMKWTSKGGGIAMTVDTGKMAVERAWKAWLVRAGLA